MGVGGGGSLLMFQFRQPLRHPALMQYFPLECAVCLSHVVFCAVYRICEGGGGGADGNEGGGFSVPLVSSAIASSCHSLACV